MFCGHFWRLVQLEECTWNFAWVSYVVVVMLGGKGLWISDVNERFLGVNLGFAFRTLLFLFLYLLLFCLVRWSFTIFVVDNLVFRWISVHSILKSEFSSGCVGRGIYLFPRWLVHDVFIVCCDDLLWEWK